MATDNAPVNRSILTAEDTENAENAEFFKFGLDLSVTSVISVVKSEPLKQPLGVSRSNLGNLFIGETCLSNTLKRVWIIHRERVVRAQ